MRLLVWNMGVGGPGGSALGHERAWQYLRDEQEFDVALLQETREPPAWASDVWATRVWKPKYDRTPSRHHLWGCAVVARTLELSAYEPDATFPWLTELRGSTAIAQAPTDPRWFASVHLHDREIPATVLAQQSVEGIELTTPDNSVWQTNVIPHELHRLFGSDTFIWGGDLNSDPKMDGIRHFLGGNRRLFEIYAEAGSRDTRARFHHTGQRTYFKSGKGAYQLDHVFADSVTEERVASWHIDERPAVTTEPYSDHAPIIVVLEET